MQYNTTLRSLLSLSFLNFPTWLMKYFLTFSTSLLPSRLWWSQAGSAGQSPPSQERVPGHEHGRQGLPRPVHKEQQPIQHHAAAARPNGKSQGHGQPAWHGQPRWVSGPKAADGLSPSFSPSPLSHSLTLSLTPLHSTPLSLIRWVPLSPLNPKP